MIMAKIINEKQDLTYLEWSLTRHSSGTAGTFLKAMSEITGEKIYYKLSNYDPLYGVLGHECINELIVDRLLNIIGIEHLHYDLIHADIIVADKKLETYICSSKDFKKDGEYKSALDVYYELEKLEDESPLEFCLRLGFDKYVYEMFLVDYLILNRDRHGANIEVLKDSKTKSIRLAPLFDHGLSLLAPYHTLKEIQKFNVMEDRKIQSYLGSSSANKNLQLIPKGKLSYLNKLKENDRDLLFEGLDDTIEKEFLDKIWDMIWERWCYYESLCNKE